MTDKEKSSEPYSEFRAGIYHHYKGHYYQTFGLAHDANDASRTAVIYIGLELDEAKTGPRLAVRTYEDFYAWVNPETGEEAVPNTPGAQPRFEYVGPSYEGQQ